MVLITDKFHKASNGTRAEATTLTAQKALAASSITVAALNGWATDTPVDFQLYNTDTSNNIIPGSQSDWTGIVSGTTITQLVLTGGSDDIYPIGAIVVCLPTANWADSLMEGVLTSLDQDGTLKAGAVDNAAVLGSDVVTTSKILNANVTTAKIADAAITSAKIDFTSVGQLTSWVPTLTGFSANPTGLYYYSKIGNQVTLYISHTTNGTSNSGVFTVTLPFASANVTAGMQWETTSQVVDNGSSMIGVAIVSNNSGVLSFFRDAAGTAFTASGSKRTLGMQITYTSV